MTAGTTLIGKGPHTCWRSGPFTGGARGAWGRCGARAEGRGVIGRGVEKVWVGVGAWVGMGKVWVGVGVWGGA